MRDTIRLGRIGGIPIGVNWSILAVAAYLIVSLGVVGFARFFPSADLGSRLLVATVCSILFFLSILGHELGHAVVARRHGIGVDGITLWLLGGLARLEQQASTPRAEFQIAAAGPFVNFVLAGAFAGAAYGIAGLDGPPLLAGAASWLVVVNLLVAVSNLIPAAPLDGGRVLTALLWWRNGDAERSRILSARGGLVAGAATAVVFLAAPLFLDAVDWWWAVIGAATGLFLARAAVGEIAAAVIRSRLARSTAGSMMFPHPPAIAESVPVSQFVAWARAEDPATACPVVRWDHEPIGYVSAPALATMAGPEQSWTTVGETMVPAESVARAWTDEPVSVVLDRIGTSGTSLAVLHDPSSLEPVGTLTRAKVDSLFASPTVWGNERDEPPSF